MNATDKGNLPIGTAVDVVNVRQAARTMRIVRTTTRMEIASAPEIRQAVLDGESVSLPHYRLRRPGSKSKGGSTLYGIHDFEVVG